MTALSTRSDVPEVSEATCPRPAIDDGRLVVIERLSPAGDAILTDGTNRALDALTILPTLGDFVTVIDTAGIRHDGYWLTLAPESHLTPGGPIVARILIGETVTRIGLPLPTPNVICEGRAEAEQMPILRALSETITDRDATIRAHEVWKAELIDDLHEEADSRDFCSEFEEFCDRHGLPGREREHTLLVTATVTYRVYVVAANLDAATESVTRDDVLARLRDSGHDDLDEFEVEED